MSARATSLILLALAAANVYADSSDSIASDRPGIADSSEVVGPRRFQVETGVQRDRRKAGDPPERKTVVPTLFRLGIGERWEARVESDVYAWMRASDADGGNEDAAAPFSLGFKHQFREAEGRTPSVGLIARLIPPSGSKSLRTTRTTGDLRVAADSQLPGEWSFNPNAGVAIEEDDEGRRFSAALLAATLAYRPMPRLELFVDGAWRRPEARGAGTAAVYDFGAAYLLSRDVQVDASIGAHALGTTPPRAFIAAGVSLRF